MGVGLVISFWRCFRCIVHTFSIPAIHSHSLSISSTHTHFFWLILYSHSEARKPHMRTFWSLHALDALSSKHSTRTQPSSFNTLTPHTQQHSQQKTALALSLNIFATHELHKFSLCCYFYCSHCKLLPINFGCWLGSFVPRSSDIERSKLNKFRMAQSTVLSRSIRWGRLTAAAVWFTQFKIYKITYWASALDLQQAVSPNAV